MAKAKMTVTISEPALAQLDADAEQAGLNRSEFVERVIMAEHYRRLLDQVEGPSWSEADDAMAREVLRLQAEA